MTDLSWSLFIGASLLAVASVALLYSSWKTPGRPLFLLGGWAAMTAAIIAAGFANGDRGMAQLSIVIMAAATAIFVLPLMQGIVPPRTAGRQRQDDVATVSHRPWRAGLSGIWTFILSGPVAGGIALFASAGFFKLIRPADGSPATAGALAIIFAVVVWAAVSVALLIEPRSGRRSIYAGACLAVSAALAFI
ncbi:MAG: hypothetical protein RLN72_01090 [Henriciella sp.]